MTNRVTNEEVEALIPAALTKKRKAILEEVGYKLLHRNP